LFQLIQQFKENHKGLKQKETKNQKTRKFRSSSKRSNPENFAKNTPIDVTRKGIRSHKRIQNNIVTFLNKNAHLRPPIGVKIQALEKKGLKMKIVFRLSGYCQKIPKKKNQKFFGDMFKVHFT
jgi:hypothetical protein